MPLYAYVCKDCGREFEEFVRFSQSDVKPQCPICGSDETQKRITSFASIGGGSDRSYTSTSASSCGSSGRFT